MAEMTPRERVLAALNHQEPDRVPLDIGGGVSTSIVVEGYDRLKAHMGVASETWEISKAFRVAQVDEPVMQRLGADLRPLLIKPAANWTPPSCEPGTMVDIWGIKWKKTAYGDGCYYWEMVEHPLAEATIEDLETFPWPDPWDPGLTAGLEEEVRVLYEYTDYAIMADARFKSFWELGYMLRGIEQMYIDLLKNPEFVTALMDKLFEINTIVTGRFLDIVGPYIQVFRTTDDMATQQRLMMKPATYRALLKPYYRQFIEFIKSKTEAKIFYHSCGNITDIVDDLAEIGVDAINPVQVSAMGDTAQLKARFGHKISFWGAIDSQRVLPFGTVEDVEAEVQRRIRDLAPGGGYVVAGVHTIQPDVPPQNIVAMADAARRYGTYPLAV
jgi:uroporphyrinogen decarboxylase